jgi:hypothetical protein
MQPWVEIRSHHGQRKLFVDGAPFLAIGIQFDYLRCTRPEDFAQRFSEAKALGTNTVFFAIQWFVVEPTEGHFDFSVVDAALAGAREQGLRISWLWFGTNQGGDFRPAPDWVKEDRARFPRMLDTKGGERDALSPHGPELLAAEKRALDRFLSHLAANDAEHKTSILLQVQNEVCIAMSHEPKAAPEPERLGFDRWETHSRDALSMAALTASDASPWAHGVGSLVRYLDALLADQKRIFPVLAYVNFPINPLRPGEDVDAYLEVPTIDFVAPDYYGFSPSDLGFALRYFRRGRNLVFVAEHSTESVGDSDGNLYRAMLEHQAQGFDPWAMDKAFGWRQWRDKVFEPPFVDAQGNWSDAAKEYARAARGLNAALRPIALALGSEELFFFTKAGMPLKLEEKRWGVHFRFRTGKNGQFVCVRTAPGDLTISGVDTVLDAYAVDPRSQFALERGAWTDSGWELATSGSPGFELSRDPDFGAQFRLDLADGRAFRLRIT